MVKGGKRFAKDVVLWVMDANFETVAGYMNRAVSSQLQNIDPWAPNSIKRLIGSAYDGVAGVVTDALHDSIQSQRDKKALEAKRAKRLEDQVADLSTGPDFLPNPLRWFRARLLYAWMPYDKTPIFGRILGSPSMWPWMVLFLFPDPRVSTLLWLSLLFLIADNRFQLATYAVLYRSTAFYSIGVCWSVSGFHALYRCSMNAEWSCDVDGPGVSDRVLWQIMIAMARMLMGSVAYRLVVRFDVADVDERRAKAQTRLEKRLVRSRGDVELGTFYGGIGGMVVGVLLSMGLIARNIYLHRTGVLDRAFSGVTATACVCLIWLCDMAGVAIGGCGPIVLRALHAARRWLVAAAKRGFAALRQACGSASGGAAASPDDEVEEAREQLRAEDEQQYDTAPLLAVLRIQQRWRYMREQRAKVPMLTIMMLWESTANIVLLLLTMRDLYMRIGPTGLWEQAADQGAWGDAYGVGALARFCSFVGLALTDGLQLHWQVRTAVYFMLSFGSLVIHLPFVFVRLLSEKLLHTGQRRSYNRWGDLTRRIRPGDAYKKWQNEREHFHGIKDHGVDKDLEA